VVFLRQFITPIPHSEIGPVQRVAAYVSHRTLALILLVQPILGYLFVTAWGDPLEIYSIIEIPAITEFDKPTSERIIDTHAYLAYGLAALSALHIMAALKHHYISRNSILTRMLPGK